ncbi:MAG: hypothetical protein J1E98_07425 [Lachnospiraceae bacterium]|nr:hypothetical protein [Lachnospiraceae bacterium]
MKKISILLCSIGAACALTACSDAMPELTEEENEIITEYAVGLLLKYDKYHESRLVDLTAYEEEQDSIEEELPEEELIEEVEENKEEPSGENTEIIEASEEPVVSSIEDFYGIQGFSFRYTGYELLDEYPAMAESEADAFFAMQATDGTQLLVLKFQVTNNSGTDQELNTLNYGMRSRITVNDEASKNVLSTLLLNDLQTYSGMLAANDSTELVAIIEVPQGISIQNISMQLRSDSDSAAIVLQ